MSAFTDVAVDDGWADVLRPLAPQLDRIARDLEARKAAGEEYLPPPAQVLRVFQEPFDEAKVLLVGQDPYPTPGHAVGLAFSVAPETRPLPRSLQNIYQERFTDLGIPPAPHGDLSAWSQQGVVLLNRVLTVGAGAANSHREIGWEEITAQAIRALAARNVPLVAVLWGKHAARVKPQLPGVPVVESAHPSPLSARRGFFGSRPFSRVNEHLRDLGVGPIDWRVGGER